MSLAKNIKTLREAAGLTQIDLGERVGVGQPAVSKWERGKAEPSASDLPKIAVAVKATITSILQGVYAQYDTARDLTDHTRTGQIGSPVKGGADVPAEARVRIAELERRVKDFETLTKRLEDVALQLFQVAAAGEKDSPAARGQRKGSHAARKTG